MLQTYLSFSLICFLLTITPGADTALVLKSAISGGRKLYLPTIFGISIGLLFHATMSSLGLSVVISKSVQLYTIIKLAGAGYLFLLGFRTLYYSWTSSASNSENDLVNTVKPESNTNSFKEFRTGLITNILNPKVAMFYITFLPQFLNSEKNIFVQSIILSLIHVGMSFIWLYIVGHFVGYFKSHLMKSSVRKKLEYLTGLSFIGFGLKLALSKR